MRSVSGLMGLADRVRHNARFKLAPYLERGRFLEARIAPGAPDGNSLLYPLKGFGRLIDLGYWPLDGVGVPYRLAYLGRRPSTFDPMYYNASAIAHYAFGLLEKWDQTGQEICLERFRRQVEFLLRHSVEGQAGGAHYAYWRYRPLADNEMCGMCQGLAISLLIRAHALFNDLRYLTLAHSYAASYRLSENAGGFVSFDGNHTVLEEYPRDSSMRHVLNGWYYAFVGLRDLAIIGELDKDLRDLLSATTSSFAELLPIYDHNGWSAYSLPAGPSTVASIAYHGVHVSMLETMAVLAPAPVYEAVGQRWDASFRSARARVRALWYKAGTRLPAWGSQ